MESNRTFFTLLFALSSLAACGGGGSGSNTALTPPTNLVYPTTDVLAISGLAIQPIVPTFEGQVDAFDVVPPLPAGLVLDAATGVLHGAPLAPTLRRTHTITARNSGGTAAAGIALEVAAPRRFALVTGAEDGSLTTLPVDQDRAGFLRGPVGAGGVAGPGATQGVARPDGSSIHVTHAANDTLVSWRFDQATGAAERFAEHDLGAGPHAVAMHPSGAWLLVACRGANSVHVFRFDPADGAPVRARIVAVGSEPSDLAFSPDGTQVFVAHAGSAPTGIGSSLASYEFGESAGTVTLKGAPLALNGGRPVAISVDPRAPYVYVAVAMFDAVLTVRTDSTGSITPIPPLRDCGGTPIDLEVDARGRYLHVAIPGENRVRAFAISPATHGLTLRGDHPTASEPLTLRRDDAGERLHVVAAAGRELATYRLTSSGGLEAESALGLRPGSSGLTFVTGTAPLRIEPRFVHCANEGSDDVHTLRIDPETGAATFVSQAYTDDRPTSLALDPRGRFAVVAAAGARTVQSFAVSAVNGALTPIGGGVAVPGTPTSVVVEPTGRFAYVAVRDVVSIGDGEVLTYGIDGVTGELALLDRRASGAASCAVAVDPTGEYLYVANAGDDAPGTATIAPFRIDPATGIPDAVGAPVPAPGVVGLAFHPDARSIYAVLRGSNALARYTIDTANGALAAVPPAAGAGFDPAALAVDPRGHFAWAAYTGNAAAGQIDVLPIQAGGGLGAAIQQIVDGQYPAALCVDLSGRFLFAANRDSHDVSVLAVDPATGVLAARAPAMAGTAPSAIVATAVLH